MLWAGIGSFAMAAELGSKPAVVGRLHPGSAADPLHATILDAFRAGMLALGQVEGRTYVIEERFAEGDAGRLPALAAELVRLKPAVILATGSAAVRALMTATTAIPIVMATVAADPVRLGFVASLARPGGNVTGIAGLLEELNVKQLELLRELVPGLAKVAFLYNSKLVSPGRLERTTTAAARLGLTVYLVGVTRAEELEAAFEAIAGAKTGGLLVSPDPEVIDRSRARIADLALRHRLPSAFTFRMFADVGGLLSYSQDVVVLHRRYATYVDKILRGANPAELPVERPGRFELVLNLKTAKALGVTIPQSILLRADEVVE